MVEPLFLPFLFQPGLPLLLQVSHAIAMVVGVHCALGDPGTGLVEVGEGPPCV